MVSSESKQRSSGISTIFPRLSTYFTGSPEETVDPIEPHKSVSRLPASCGKNTIQWDSFAGNQAIDSHILPTKSNYELKNKSNHKGNTQMTLMVKPLQRLSMQQNVTTSTWYRKLNLRSSLSGSSQSLERSASSMPAQSDDLLNTFGSLRRCVSVPPLKPARTLNRTMSPSICKYRPGTCVVTQFGTGTVTDYRPSDDVYTISMSFVTAYIQANQIVREIKAAVGERVRTRWGTATIDRYYITEDMYGITLDWRWDNEHIWRMKATTKKFDKIPTSTFGQTVQMMQSTKKYLVHGYSLFREGTYASKMYQKAKMGQMSFEESDNLKSTQSLKKAITSFGGATIAGFRPQDHVFIANMPFGAVAYLHANMVQLQPRRSYFDQGERVQTPFGVGRIAHFRECDYTYQVSLDQSYLILYVSDVQAEWTLTSVPEVDISESASTQLTRNSFTVGRISSILSSTRNSVISASATMKVSASERFPSFSTVKARVLTAANTISTFKSQGSKFANGDRVIAKPFGSGFVKEFRPSDRIYTIILRRVRYKGYFHESSLQPFPFSKVTHIIVDGKSVAIPDLETELPETKRQAIISAALQSAKEKRQVVP
uniref:Uncharacterized protein AlNc14C4G537 n=1 Tax=Albugo laibachii Nc14 TaxID=890382 RepID=F0W095_9STRA|nr:conserved hypothetical protein [Albugo laibachii Nc14]|eukprot:CCA14466.1 conserved hypothetical protein [Albugo laibachii Nc14]